MSKNFLALMTSSDSDFFLDLTGVVSGLAEGEFFTFLLPSGFVDLFRDLFFAEDPAVGPDPGACIPS